MAFPGDNSKRWLKNVFGKKNVYQPFYFQLLASSLRKLKALKNWNNYFTWAN